MKKKLLASLFAFWATNTMASPNITIYNNNLALISEERGVSLEQGLQKIYLDNVSEQLNPDSTMIYGKSLNILEKNYSYNLINFQNVLDDMIGKDVLAISTNPQTGKDIIKNAKLIANNYGKPVLEFDYGIEFDFNGRVAVKDIPKNFSSTPVLEVLLKSEIAQNQTIDFSYLTNGLNWSTNYIATINDGKINLSAWADINNSTGIDYKNANIRLLAGDVNSKSRAEHMADSNLIGVAKSASYSRGVSQNTAKPVGDYYFYQFKNKVSLQNNQSKQIILFEKNDINYKKEYKFYSPLNISSSHSKSFDKLTPSIVYNIKNDAQSGLNIILPSGSVKFYDNKEGQKTFLGEDSVKQTALDQELDLSIGKASDFYANGKIVYIKKASSQPPASGYGQISDISKADVEITFYNAKDKAQEVVFEQNFVGEWKILKENIKSTKKNAKTNVWKINIPAKSNIVLTFSAEDKR